MTTNTLVHPQSNKILDGQLRLELLYQTRRGGGRPATREVTTSGLALADTLEGEERTPGGEGGKGRGERQEENSFVTVLTMVTVPPTEEHILANGA